MEWGGCPPPTSSTNGLFCFPFSFGSLTSSFQVSPLTSPVIMVKSPSFSVPQLPSLWNGSSLLTSLGLRFCSEKWTTMGMEWGRQWWGLRNIQVSDSQQAVNKSQCLKSSSSSHPQPPPPAQLWRIHQHPWISPWVESSCLPPLPPWEAFRHDHGDLASLSKNWWKNFLAVPSYLPCFSRELAAVPAALTSGLKNNRHFLGGEEGGAEEWMLSYSYCASRMTPELCVCVPVRVLSLTGAPRCGWASMFLQKRRGSLAKWFFRLIRYPWLWCLWKLYHCEG